MATVTTECRIYAACLASYNAGKLHGAWIDCDDADGVHEAIQAMLKASPEPDAEEYAVHDHEGFGGFNVGEHPDVDELCELAEAIEEHGKIFVKYYECTDSKATVSDAAQNFTDAYFGYWKSLGDYAEESYTACNEVPESLAYYIDYDSMGRDWELGGDIFTIDDGGSVHVFDNHV